MPVGSLEPPAGSIQTIPWKGDTRGSVIVCRNVVSRLLAEEVEKRLVARGYKRLRGKLLNGNEVQVGGKT